MQIIQSSLARALSAIIMGVLLIKYREETVTWLTIVIGILFFLSGVISCVAYFVARRRDNDVQLFDADGRQLSGFKPSFPLTGLGSIVLGLILALMPGAFISWLMFILAAILILGAIGIAALALLGVMDREAVKWAVIAVGIISGLGIYMFNNPKRNPLINIGSGLWDTYNMATGLMGDVLSYIRLYALGLAGGMLGAAFNNLAGMLKDGIPVPGLDWIGFLLIIIIGHALNLAMSCLGAFVHPLRLTFVEYFKNSGYEGRGKAYKPLTIEK